MLQKNLSMMMTTGRSFQTAPTSHCLKKSTPCNFAVTDILRRMSPSHHQNILGVGVLLLLLAFDCGSIPTSNHIIIHHGASIILSRQSTEMYTGRVLHDLFVSGQSNLRRGIQHGR